MDELLNMFFVSGDLVTSFFKLMLLVIVLDFCMGFFTAIKSIKQSVI